MKLKRWPGILTPTPAGDLVHIFFVLGWGWGRGRACCPCYVRRASHAVFFSWCCLVLREVVASSSFRSLTCAVLFCDIHVQNGHGIRGKYLFALSFILCHLCRYLLKRTRAMLIRVDGVTFVNPKLMHFFCRSFTLCQWAGDSIISCDVCLCYIVGEYCSRVAPLLLFLFLRTITYILLEQRACVKYSRFPILLFLCVP